jgi:gas vesicle protein GvpL/GvpF
MDPNPSGEPSDAVLARLRRAIGELAAQDAHMLLDEARAEAQAQVRELLARALRDSMLTAIEAEMPGVSEPDGRLLPILQAPGTAVPSREAARSASRALYVYGVVSGDLTLGALPVGVDGVGIVHAVSEARLTALVSEVAGADFDEQRLREHLGDMAWVQDTARRHELVLEAIGALATVIPMRMCTVYPSEDEIRQLLAREARALREGLRYLEGKAEWGVKVFSDPFAGAQPGADRGTSGADYMRGRLRDREARANAAQRAEDAARHVHEVLDTVAEDSVIVSPQVHEHRDPAGELLLNGVYLVQDASREDFRAQARALARSFVELGIELELTGPWPAYNFVPGTIGAAW